MIKLNKLTDVYLKPYKDQLNASEKKKKTLKSPKKQPTRELSN